MLVLSMNSKRQRRPNVRLGEIGDASAAFACGFSQKTKENLVHKRWKPDFLNSQVNEPVTVDEFSKGKSPDFLNLDTGFLPADLQQNRENKNPNSSKLGFDLVTGDEIDMMKSSISFGTITRKSRVMKRRGWIREGNNSAFLCSAWAQSPKFSPEFNGGDRKEQGDEEKEFMGIESNACIDSQDISDHDAYEPNSWQQGNADDCYEGDNAFLRSGDEWDQTRYAFNDVTGVRTWLEDLGFGRYAGIFEMHEVDQETLPLLTLDDLKEMGVFAVGHRRKLYTAIQQLRGGNVSS